VVARAPQRGSRLFVEELGAIVAKLRDGTAADRQKYAARGGHIIWRILMPITRNHVYYRVNDSADEVEVLSCGTRSLEATPISRTSTVRVRVTLRSCPLAV
jgi:hypothetical protein